MSGSGGVFEDLSPTASSGSGDIGFDVDQLNVPLIDLDALPTSAEDQLAAGLIPTLPEDEDTEGDVQTSGGGGAVLTAEFTQEVDVRREVDGTKFVNQYKKIAKLAAGALCTVKLYQNSENGQYVAIKSYHKSRLARLKTYYTDSDGRMAMRTAMDHLQREIDLLSGLTPHENICKLLHVMDDEEHHKTYLVFPYYGGGTLMLFDSKNSVFYHHSQTGTRGLENGCPTMLNLNAAITYLANAACGLAHLHLHNIAHRDVKPSNILLSTSRKRAVLADLGSAKQFMPCEACSEDGSDATSHENCGGNESGGNTGDGVLRETEGTYSFFAPEMCRGEPFNAYSADVWALGVTAFSTIISLLPFSSSNPKDLFELIGKYKGEDLPSPKLDEADQNPRLCAHLEIIQSRLQNTHVRKLLQALLNPVASLRPSAQEAADLLLATAKELAN